VDIEAVMSLPVFQGATKNNNGNDMKEAETTKYQIIQAKSTNISLKTISEAYGWSQVVTAFVGGFAVTPAGKHEYFPRAEVLCIIDEKSLTFNLPLTTSTLFSHQWPRLLSCFRWVPMVLPLKLEQFSSFSYSI